MAKPAVILSTRFSWRLTDPAARRPDEVADALADVPADVETPADAGAPLEDDATADGGIGGSAEALPAPGIVIPVQPDASTSAAKTISEEMRGMRGMRGTTAPVRQGRSARKSAA